MMETSLLEPAIATPAEEQKSRRDELVQTGLGIVGFSAPEGKESCSQGSRAMGTVLALP